MIVLDASAGIELVLHTDKGEHIAAAISTAGTTVHVPHLFDLEVAQVLRRFVRQGDVTGARADSALKNLVNLGFWRHPHLALVPRIWSLRHNLTAYDATYVALCEALDAVLLTLDRRLVNSPGLRINCHVP